MDAFITGSRAYGKVKPSSDIDLVIRCDHNTADTLRRFGNSPKESDDSQTIRFGMLNIIVCTTDEQFAVWKIGTRKMQIAKANGATPFGREEATAVFNILREMVGIADQHDSSESVAGPKKE